MTADGWKRAVRQQLGLGRLLPLGGPRDGAWLAEAAAGAVLRRAARDVPGVRPDGLRIALADPEDTDDPVVPPPPGALPPGPLRVTADFAATAAEPLPTTASRLRAALSAAAADRLGLRVTEVDLRVTALLEDLEGSQEAAAGPGEAPAAEGSGRATPADDSGAPDPAGPGDATPPGDAAPGSSDLPDPSGPGDTSASGDAARVARAVLAVPGVTRLTGVPGRPVRFQETAGAAALPRRHVQVQCAVRADHRVLDVAREVRARAAEVLPDRPTVTVLVTAVE
ncbi:nucleopolyhedrovirus P10 family protein [Streptomyces sp. NPDC051207]|uniref:nucleopolyhedrovirus P10 family protein n=1 Tax=Streptomyces sp. NPDC051207 TaxID=3154641 RepID=UPI0034176822